MPSKVTRENLLLMSLAENLARKRYRAVELVKEIGAMKDRGHDYATIARKIDLDVEYVKGIIRLLNKGESSLLGAVEGGHIPITITITIAIAITIASSDDAAVQRALTEAYESKSLRGKALLKARQLIEQRRRQGKADRAGVKSREESVTAQKVLRTFQREMGKHRYLVKRAKASETRLLFIVSAMKSLLQNEDFRTLLKAEALTSLPKYIADQVKIKEN